MTDPGRADLVEALHHELLEREARLKELIERLLEREQPREWSAGTAGRAPSGRPADPISLTEREVQVMQLVVRGHTNRAIGAELGVGAATIRNHLGRIYRKLGAMTRTHAAVRAIELGLCRAGPVEET